MRTSVTGATSRDRVGEARPREVPEPMTTTQTRPARRAGTAAVAAVTVPRPRRDRRRDNGLGDSLAALEPAGEVPLHLQLRCVLDRAVDASGRVHGDRIWSESELMRHYKVSRHVVRQALN